MYATKGRLKSQQAALHITLVSSGDRVWLGITTRDGMESSQWVSVVWERTVILSGVVLSRSDSGDELWIKYNPS